MLKKYSPLLLVLAAGLCVRLFFSTVPPFKIDMDAWLAWGDRVLTVGPAQFFSGGGWNAYFPGYIYFLWLTASIAHLLSPHASREILEFYYKLVPIVFDLLNGYIIYLLVKEFLHSIRNRLGTHEFEKGLPYLASLVYLLSPFTIFNSTIWGQADSAHTFFMLFSFYNLFKQKPYKSSVSLAIAAVIKPQALFVAPLYLLFYLKNFNFKQITSSVAFFLLTFYLLAAPFWGLNVVNGALTVLKQNEDAYHYNSLNEFNFWGIYGFWQDDRVPFLFGFTMKTVGYALCLLGILWGLYMGVSLKKKTFIENFIPYTALAFFFIFSSTMFLTQMHERYMYPLFAYLVIFIFAAYPLLKKTWTSIILLSYYGLFSTVHFLNLFYVYIYYTYFGKAVPAENKLYYLVSDHLVLYSYFVVFLYFIGLFITFYSIRKLANIYER